MPEFEIDLSSYGELPQQRVRPAELAPTVKEAEGEQQAEAEHEPVEPRMQYVARDTERLNGAPAVGEPDPCGFQGFGHDSRQCIACTRRIAWVRKHVKQDSAPEAVALPAVTRLDQFLAEPDPEVTYRVDRLLPVGGNGLLAAAQKAGKSTLIGNVLRSVADGQPFLDSFEVQQADRIVLIDDELDPRTLRRWLRAHEIKNPERIDVLPLRGSLSSFDILDAATRARWAEAIGSCEVLILDCLRPTLDALGLDENHDAGKFLVAWDELKQAVRASESLVVHHMGHSAERSRGDSRILDWPDAIWNLVRQDAKDPASPRYFSAYGRDVEVAEGRLTHESESRRLSYYEGTRKAAREAAALVARLPLVEQFITANPGKSTNEITEGVAGDANATRKALTQLIEDGAVTREKRQGRGGGYAHFIRNDEP